MYLLIATCERYRIEAQAFCLMGNHVHLVLYCPEPVLSAAMRDLKSRYAKYFHRYHKSSGPLFEAPFLEVPILTDEHLMTEVRYTHRNPLDLDATVCLATCQWSSHGIYLGLRPEPSFMNTSVVRELFGPNYRLEVERPRPNDKVQNRVRPIIDMPKVTSPGEHNFSSKEALDAGLQVEQETFDVETAAEADQGAVAANYSVAGHDDRDRIAAIGSAHGLEGSGVPGNV